MPQQLILNGLTPDFESIQAQLNADLPNRAGWEGVLPIQTGSTLIDWIASIGAFDQQKLLRYYQDSFPETALSDRAILSIASMQGVRLVRKNPATIDVQLLSTMPANVPAFTQFQGAGSYWFSTEAVTLTSNVPTTVSLKQGYIVDHTINGIGVNYQTYITPESKFSVSDTDVYVSINGNQIQRVTSGNWKLKGIPGFLDWTLPEGRLLIQFGTADYGYVPLQSDEVRIVYAVTSGADANTVPTMTKVLTVTGFPGVTVTVQSNPTGGINEPGTVLYKTVAAPNFGSFGSSVTKSQYISTILQYPGVIDTLTFAQREVDPTDLRWMNMIHVYLLTSNPWNIGQQQAFMDWLQSNTMFSTKFVLKDPLPVVAAVEVNLYCYNWATPSQCQSDALAAIQKVFEPTAGIIGKDITIWDIQQAISKSNKGIDYADILSPTQDLIVSNPPVTKPVLSVSATSGELSPGNYSYAIAAVMANGQIVAKNWSTITVTGFNVAIDVSWPAIPGAVNYVVYGRGGLLGNYGQLVNLPSTSFTDTGPTAFPVGAVVPTVSTTPVQYNQLDNLVVNAFYTLRTNRLSTLGG